MQRRRIAFTAPAALLAAAFASGSALAQTKWDLAAAYLIVAAKLSGRLALFHCHPQS